MASAPADAQQPPVITLTRAVAEAFDQGERMLNQRDSVDQAALSVRSARNVFQPKLIPNVQGSFGQTDVSNQNYRLDLTQKLTTGTELRFGIGTSSAQIPSPLGARDVRFYNADTTLMVTQPLLKGFGSTVARRSLTTAEVRQDDAARERRITEQQVALEVAAAYYRAVAQRTLVEVARKSFDRARQLREASESKLTAGLVSQLDVLRAQQLVIQAELQLLDAQSAVEDAYDDLRFLMGRDTTAPFEVAGEIPRRVDTLSLDDALRIAEAERLDLKTATAGAADAERGMSYARNQLLPQVDVNLALTRRQTSQTLAGSFGMQGFQIATFFNISMPVDRTPQLVEFQNTLIDRDRQRRNIDALRRRIAFDVERGVRERERALRNLTAAETNVEIAGKEVEVAQFRYDRGLSNNLDVVTAETNLLNAESRRVLTLAELALTRLRMRATVGILDPRSDMDGGDAGGQVTK